MKTNNEVKAAFNCGVMAEGGNIRTDGRVLTSYRTDIAAHINGVTLRTCFYFSKTTSHHISGIYADFDVPHVNPQTTAGHRDNFDHLRKVAEELWKKAERARKYRDEYTEQAREAERKAERYAALFITA